MLAMVLTNDRKTRLERRPVPTPSDDQVLVNVDPCGICGSDLHAPDLREVYLGGFVMGHEPAGRIAGVGGDVSGWRVGQRLTINPNGYTCGVCEACRSGRLNHCIPQRWNGLLAYRPTARWRHTWRSHQKLCMPCRTRWAPSSLVGWSQPPSPLRAVLAAGELSGRSLLVVGGGPIGQLCCRLARHYGAAPVWLSEPSAERRSYAEASQADRAFDPTIEAADIERLKTDLVLECSGSEPGIRSSLAAARPEGTVVVVGGGRSGLDPPALNGRTHASGACVLVFRVVRDSRDQARHLRLSPVMGPFWVPS